MNMLKSPLEFGPTFCYDLLFMSVELLSEVLDEEVVILIVQLFCKDITGDFPLALLDPPLLLCHVTLAAWFLATFSS